MRGLRPSAHPRSRLFSLCRSHSPERRWSVRMGDESAPLMSNASALEQLTPEAESFAGFGRWAWSRHGGFEHSDNLRTILTPRGMAWNSAREVLRALSQTSRKVLVRVLRHVIRGEHVGTLSLTCKAPDGMDRSLSVTLHVTRDVAGLRLAGLARDVTRITELSTALQKSESRWQMALESAGQGVWDSDIETGTVYHSRTWYTMRGMDPEGAAIDQHDNWVTRLHPDDRRRILQEFDRQHDGSVPKVEMEYRERLPDGNYIWISSLGAIVEWYPDGRPRRINGTDTDITARKQAEQQHERLSRRLRLALEVSRIGVYDINFANGESLWDGRMREIYGRATSDTAAPADWGMLLHPDA